MRALLLPLYIWRERTGNPSTSSGFFFGGVINLPALFQDICNLSPAAYDYTLSEEVSQLLLDWSDGDGEALNKLIPIVYREMRRLAHHTCGTSARVTVTPSRPRPSSTRLTCGWPTSSGWAGRTPRAHFFAVAAQVMRRILVDHARQRNYAKRGGGRASVSLDEAAFVSAGRSAEVLAVDDALQGLEAWKARKGRSVELRFFSG